MNVAGASHPTPLSEASRRSTAAQTAPCADASSAARSGAADHASLTDRAVRLYAALLDADSLALGAHRLAALFATQGGFHRVTVGLCGPRGTRLIASSDSQNAASPGELQQLLLGAMDEALEQGVTLTCGGSESPSGPVVVEQRLLQRHVGGAVATVPLGVAGLPVAACCIERRGPTEATAFSDVELRQLEAQLELAAPALRWLQIGTESGWQRARRDLLQHWTALCRPDRRGVRRWLVAGFVGVVFLAVVPLDDHVAGRARIEGAEQRVMVAPTDGFIKAAHVRPGDRVIAGAALVDLLEADLRLERERWSSQLAQHENAYAAAMSKSDRVASATSMARVSEAQAQLSLVEEQLTRGRLTAPFDAQVIDGDLSQSIGAPVRQGDPLLTLATTGRQRVIIEVDEVDIARVAAGQRGELAISSLPWGQDALVVERIAPMSRAVDGRNVFEVEARLTVPREELRPGLLGRAKLVSGSAPVLWTWLRHAAMRLRVALWGLLA